MIDKFPSRELNPHASASLELGPQRTLLVRTPKRTYGFRYSGLLSWEGTESVLILHFTRADVIIHGKNLLTTYAHKLTDDRLAELIEPQRADRFGAGVTGSAGVEKIEVESLEQ